MLDLFGIVVAAALMVLAVSAATTYLDIPRDAKLALATIAGVWIGIAAAAGAAGMLAISRPFPVIGPFVIAPLAAAAIAAAFPAARAAILSLPLPLMIGINVGRVFGGLFLVLAAQGRLAGPFPYCAGLGDIITGALALPVASLAATDVRRHANVITAWNLFGAADLFLAITLGITSAEGSPLQVFTAVPGSAAMQQLPWSFVPTVLVPFWLILHAIIAVKLQHARRAAA